MIKKLNQQALNRLLRGSHGTVWLNGKEMITTQKIELKMAGDFETVQVCGDNTDYSLYNGWNGSGTLEYLKYDSEVSKLIVEAFVSGVMPEIEMICLLENPATGKRERCRVSDITFTEATVLAFEKKAFINDSVPFNFSSFEYLENSEY